MSLAALPRPLDLTARRTASATNAVAAVALFLLGLNYPLPHGLTVGFVVVAAGAPVWLSAPGHFRDARPMLALGVAAVINGLLLTWWSSTNHSIDRHDAISSLCEILTALGGIAIVLWARRTQSTRRIALYYGAGSLITAIQHIPGSDNPWKHQLSVPVTIIVLGLMIRTRSTAQAVAATGLAVIGVANDCRSYAAFCLLAALIVWWRRPPANVVLRPRPVAIAVLLAGLAIGTYVVGTALLVDGYLGKGLQQRSVAQVRASGSLIAGGRPEWGATRRLMLAHPTGYGVGVSPNNEDRAIGKSGLQSLHISTAEGYADHFLFADQFKLHSVFADSWCTYGWVGAMWAALSAVILARALITRMATRTAPALVVFLVIMASWDIGFSPIYSALAEVAFAFSIALVGSTPRRQV